MGQGPDINKLSKWWDSTVLKSKPAFVKSTVRGYKTYNYKTETETDSTYEEIEEYQRLKESGE